MAALVGLISIEVSDGGGEDEFEPDDPQPKASESRIEASENAPSGKLKYREASLYGMAVPFWVSGGPSRVSIPARCVQRMSQGAVFASDKSS